MLIIINTEKNQKFLALMYSLQNNESNAVITPRIMAREISKQKVYRAYDHMKREYIYSLEPIEDTPPEDTPPSNVSVKKNAGGRPEVLTEKQKRTNFRL